MTSHPEDTPPNDAAGEQAGQAHGPAAPLPESLQRGVPDNPAATPVLSPEEVAIAEDALPDGPAGSGYEQRMADIALESGMVSSENVQRSLEKLASLRDAGLNKSLSSIFIGDGLLTVDQLDIIKLVIAREDAPKEINGFKIISRIGEGAMGNVYKARQVALDRIVALKILPDRLAADAKYVTRFLREVKAAAKLDHPNIVRSIDAGHADGKYYFAMEFIEGRSLEDIIIEKGALSEEEALVIAIQAAGGLECAWKAGLVHRDIKPDNILITADSVAKIADLGLSKDTLSSQSTRLTQDGYWVGTPFYVSPEQIRSEDVDIRSDIYSLGITLYRMVTGSHAFDGKDSISIIYKRFSEDPMPVRQLNPDVSEGLTNVINTMLQVDRDDRYPDPAVLLHDLELVAAGKAPQFASHHSSVRKRALASAYARRRTGIFAPVVVRRRVRHRVMAVLLPVLVGAVAGIFFFHPFWKRFIAGAGKSLRTASPGAYASPLDGTLNVLSIVPLPADPAVGDTVSVNVTVQNLSSTPAGMFTVALFYDRSSPPSPGNPPDDARTVASLGPGESAVITFTGISCAFSVAWNMYAIVDNGNAVPEKDETDNLIGPILIRWSPAPPPSSP
ncbi:MAG: protein kinase [Planctomycetes bacterium]|nr:protein kinase [Planctomycetota bacterium]